MQTLVYQTEVRQAITEPGVKPDNPQRIYRLDLRADTTADFAILAEILDGLKDRAKREGYAIIEEEAENLETKAKAAKNN